MKSHTLEGRKVKYTILSGYTAYLDNLLRNRVTNSSVCLQRLREIGYTGGLTTVKDYISTHKHLVPSKRQMVVTQGDRGRRFTTEVSETYQMGWGFTKVQDNIGSEYTIACFAMVCHYCGQQYAEFFPNTKQENLFIGMLHAFGYMGIPKYILTNNMKSVVIRRDFNGYPI